MCRGELIARMFRGGHSNETDKIEIWIYWISEGISVHLHPKGSYKQQAYRHKKTHKKDRRPDETVEDQR